MTCLDDAVVLRAVSGELSAAELATLDAHLDGCGDCRALVGAAGLALGSGRDGAAAVDELAPGTRLGRYVVERRLGAGAMGVVYAARDPELDRAVAIKLVRPERAAEPHRLVREAQAMARVAHPHVVTIHDVGRHGDDVYVAMERVDGPTLATWAAARSLDARLAAVIAVGRGLAAVHAAGLVHRDVKPANVLVGTDERPRLGDFGLAAGEGGALVDVRGVTDATLTATGAMVGTPAYMAPEVLRGEPATAASDQWSFAILAWEVLLGARPFAGADIAALRASIDRGVPSTTRRSGAERRLAVVLRRALAPAPADRYPEVDALVAALAPTRSARVKVIAVGAALIAIATIVAVVVTRGGPSSHRDACAVAASAIDPIWSDRHPARATTSPPLRAALDRYAARWSDARVAVCTAARHDRDALADVRAACLATRAAGLAAVVDGLARPGPWSAAVASLVDPDECATSPALALFAPVPPPQREAVAALSAQIAAARVRSAVADAVPALRALVTRADELGHRPTQAAAQLALAEALRRLGQYPDADRAAEAAALAAAAGHDDLTAARAWLVRVGVAGDRRDLHAAGAWLPHAAAAVERAGTPALLAAQVDNSAGLLALDQGRLDDAAAALGRALTARSAIAGEDVEVARTLSALGHLARLRGDLTAARDLHQRALAIDRAALGAHLDTARDLHNLGGVLRLQGALDAAATAYREALAIREAALGADHPEVALVHNSLGILAIDRGALADATRELEAARTSFTAHDHLDLAIAIANLGRVALAAGEPARALALLDEAIALDRAQLPAQHPRLAQNLLVAVRAALSAGAATRARALIEQAAAALPPDAVDEAAELDALRRQVAPRSASATATMPPPPPLDAGAPPLDAPPAPVDASTPPVDAAPADARRPLDARLAPDAYVPRGVYGSSQGWD